MMRSLLLLALFTGCLPPENDDPPPAEGDHLVVHVASGVEFDQLVVDVGANTADHHVMYFPNTIPGWVYDQWWSLAGEGATEVHATAFAHGLVVGTGERHGFTYTAAQDGSFVADVTLALSAP